MTQETDMTAATEEDLPALRRFLIEGFGESESAICFDEKVLRWKYFEPIGSDRRARSLITRHKGKIVGHIGLCPREFIVRGSKGARVSTVHFIDWLASREHPLVGLTLMLQGCETAQTQYGVGGSADGRAMLLKMGYEVVGSIGDYFRVISPGYRLRSGGSGIRKLAAAARDAGRVLLRPARKPAMEIELRQVEEFTQEIDDAGESAEGAYVLTARSRELLNYYLRFPGGRITGWTIHADGGMRGFALLGMFTEDGAAAGRIIECFMGSGRPELTHGAIWSIARELKSRGVEIVSSYASAPWLRKAFEENGFYLQRELPLTLRDSDKLLPRNLPFHVSQLEGDYAYL